MKIDIKTELNNLGINFIELENNVLGTQLESSQKDNQIFPLAIYQWTAGDEREYIRIIMIPFIERPKDGFSFDLVHKILNINHQIPLIKFTLDDDGDLALVLDVDVETWSQKSLVQSFDILGPFADYCFSEIESL